MDFFLVSSLASLGFFGGFTHCTGMCGPLVISQVSNNLSKTSLVNYNFLTRLKNCALIPYHLGRITTYSLIALLSRLLVKSFDETRFYEIFSAILLIISASFFLKIFLEGNDFFLKKFYFLKNFILKIFRIDNNSTQNFTKDNFIQNNFSKDNFIQNSNKNSRNISNKNSFDNSNKISNFIFIPNFLRNFLVNFLKKSFDKFSKKFFLKFIHKNISQKFSKLFANPRGINGFFLGLILGFLPCGLIYGAVSITLNFSSPIYSAIGMIIFGVSTFPALFLTGYFGGFIFKFKSLKFLAKFIIFLNIVMLLMLAIKQILL
jgi:sulfite exporter TauE/SafE